MRWEKFFIDICAITTCRTQQKLTSTPLHTTAHKKYLIQLLETVFLRLSFRFRIHSLFRFRETIGYLVKPLCVHKTHSVAQGIGNWIKYLKKDGKKTPEHLNCL